MVRNILLATDGSAAVDAAIPHAIRLAMLYDAELHALYVMDVRRLPRDGDLSDIGSVTYALNELEEEGENAVEHVVSAGERQGVKVVSAVEKGVPAQNILSYISKHDIDLVVMGTHGRTGMERLLIGSVAENVVRQSPVPVLTVSPDRS